ncbi:MAG: hypothetical protein ACFBZ8_10365 [Opitutales bacterium]
MTTFIPDDRDDVAFPELEAFERQPQASSDPSEAMHAAYLMGQYDGRDRLFDKPNPFPPESDLHTCWRAGCWAGVQA